MFGVKTRHVLRKFHITRFYVKQKEITVSKVWTGDAIAGPITEPLPQA